MDIKLIRNSEDAVFSSISNGLILQLTDDNYKFLDFTGKKMYILNSTTNEKYEISPEIKKYINLIYFNSTPISPTAVTALLFISVTGSNLK